MQLSSRHPIENITGEVIPCVFSREVAPPQNGQGFNLGIPDLEFRRIRRFVVAGHFTPIRSLIFARRGL
jgi:hypothetical protein